MPMGMPQARRVTRTASFSSRLMIYDAGGAPVGIVRYWEKVRTIFRSYPGRTPEFAVHLSDEGAAGLREALEAVVPGNACLQHFVAGMVEKDAAYLKAFIHTLDQALGDVVRSGHLGEIQWDTGRYWELMPLYHYVWTQESVQLVQVLP